MCILKVKDNWGIKGVHKMADEKNGKVVRSTMMEIRAAVSVRFHQPPVEIPPGTAAAVCG